MNPLFTITNKITADLTRIERARGFIEAATLSEDWIAEMGHRALILEAHHTTHIEGTRLTLEQAENLIGGVTVPDADPDDVKELLNYRDAFDWKRRTIQRDLKVMVELEIITAHGATNNLEYELANQK